jgi:inorganic pyrophosphatase
MDLAALPTFASPDTIHVVVESPRGTALKLKYESRWQAMSVSRPLPQGMTFPFDWGFIPSTRADDGDPIDAFVMWDIASYPGVVVPCRVLGVLRIEQNATNFDASRRIRNDRILVLPLAAKRESDWNTVADIPDRIRQECEQFTIASTVLEGKNVTILGWGDAAEALALLV